MKQMIKYTLEIAAMLLVTLGASAQTAQTANIIYKLDGTVQTTGSMPGSVNVDFTNGTITITPGEGNYFHLKKAEDLKVVKVIDGSHATTRDGEPGFNTSIAITPKDETADPSKTTVYTFTKLEDTNYGLEVTANFHSRISVENATVSGLKDSYTYTGEAIKPVVTVKVGDNTLTLDKDYRAFYSDSINASTNAVKGKITLYGICEYMGTQQIEYIIAKADPTLTFSPTTATITFGKETAFEKPVLTTTPAGLAVTYQVKDGDDGVAQVNSADGGITPLVPGQATIEAVFAGNANYNEAKGQYTLTVAKGTAVVTVAPVAKDNLTYTGGDQELVNEGTATDGTMMYRIGTEGDFSADIPKGNAAGEYTVYYKAVAINSDQFNDSEALSITATIKGKSIANAIITLTPSENFTYNGQNQKPEVSVKDGETDLVLDQDYTLTNEGGTNVGEYTVTVTGKDNYDSQTTASKTFNITALETTPTVTLNETSFVYDGTEKKPAVTVTVVLPGATASTELTTDDYDVAYSENVNVGVNTAKATVTLKRNYVGQNTATFTITPKSIANATITLTPESFTYNKELQKPSVSVKDGETTLVVDQDYTLTNDGGTNVGEYTVTVKGKGNYDPETSVSKKYYITAGTLEVTAEGFEGTYDQAAHSIKVNAPESATIKYGTAEGTYDLTTNPSYTNVGTYTVYYQVSMANYADVTGSKSVVINAKSIANVTITLTPESFTFNGENQKPTVTVKDGETNLVLDTDYTLTNEGGTDVGKYTVTVTGKGNYSGTASKEYSITANTMEVTAEGFEGTYDKAAHSIKVNAPEGATIKYGTAEGTYDLTTNPSYTNVGTYTVYYQVSMDNYAEVTGSKSVVINAKSIADVTITLTPESFTFNGENQKPTVTVKDGETNLVLDNDYTLTNEGGTDVGKYTVTVTGKGNYSGTASKEYSITSNTMEVTAEGYTGTYDGKAHGITVTAPKGATIKYGTAEGTYDLTTNPSYTNVGTYTVYYQVSMENYADVTGSKNVVISQATVTLSYSASTAEGKMGEAFTAPTLNNPSQVAVTYSSSNTQVATIGTDGVVTLTGAGKTTITATFAGNDNYASATASYELTVGKQQDAGLSWTDEGMEYYIGDYWYGPRLNNPNNLKVKYESSDEDVATIDENGVITVLGVGDTWIMAIFEGSDEYEPQTVRYGLFVKERYNLWVDGTQVTSDNRRDILGDGQFFYDEDKKMLVVTNSTKAVDIENRKGDLTIFLNGSSKLGRIFFNKGETDNSGKLTITTYENIPGATTLETSNANGVISGFSSLTIDEDSYTFLLDPTKGQYQGGKLVTAEGAVAQTAIIGQYIKPLVNGQTVTFPPGDFDIENLTNAVIKDLLMTLLMDLGTSQVETDDDYYDPLENCIVLNNLNSTNGVSVVVDNVQKGQYIPGSSDFAAAFKGGITFMVPNGEGKIILNVQTEPGYKLMLMIDNGIPTEIVKNERGDVEVDYNVEKPTYCFLYLEKTADTRGTRIGKREKSHGKVFSLKVSPAKSLSTNPLGGVPGFPDSKTPEVDTFGEDDPTGINEIKVETDNTLEGNEDNWYDLQGRRIDKPTKAGIYIQNRKKIVIR